MTRRAQRLLDVRRRLEAAHGPHPWRPRWGRAIDVLVRLMLAQNTTSRNADRGFRALKRDLPTWERVRAAAPGEIERRIGVCGLGQQRARRLREVLEIVRRDRGRLSLAFLNRLPAGEAETYLTNLPGVGPHTAACTLLFAFGTPVLPIDKGILRVARRLGLVPRKTGQTNARRLLERATAGEPAARYPLHVLLFRHAKEVCQDEPRCGQCVLEHMCPKRIAGTRRPRPAARPGDGIGHGRRGGHAGDVVDRPRAA